MPLHTGVMHHIITACHQLCSFTHTHPAYLTLWYWCWHYADRRIQSQSGTHIQSLSQAELQKGHMAVVEIDPAVHLRSRFLTLGQSVLSLSSPVRPLGTATGGNFTFCERAFFVRGFQSSTYGRCASARNCALHILSAPSWTRLNFNRQFQQTEL